MTASTSPPGALVKDSQLPALYQAADRASRSGQQLWVRLRAAQLLLVVLAAPLGAVPLAYGGVLWGALLAGFAFAAAGLIEATILTVQPDKAWYQGRAVA